MKIVVLAGGLSRSGTLSPVHRRHGDGGPAGLGHRAGLVDLFFGTEQSDEAFSTPRCLKPSRR